MTRIGALGVVSGGTEVETHELEHGSTVIDPDAEAIVEAKRATEQHRQPADRPNAGARSNPALLFHRLRADIGHDRDAESLLAEAGAADGGQRGRLQKAMRARKSAELEVADLETTIRSLTNQWSFLLGKLAALRDDHGAVVFPDADRALGHVVDLARNRGWVFSPHVRVLPDPFAGKVPLKELGAEESGLLLISSIKIKSRKGTVRPYRLAVGKEPKRDPSDPTRVWQLHRPYAFIDLEVANAVARYEPSIFRRLPVVASMASHDLSAHSVADVQLPGRDENYLLLTWERALSQDRILDPQRCGVPNLEVLSARLHRVLWSLVLDEEGGRARRAIFAHAQRFFDSVERFRGKMAADGDPRADELAEYLLAVYFDKNLFFVMDPNVVRAELGIDVTPGLFQREIHASDRQSFGEQHAKVGEILAQFLEAYRSF